MKLCDTSVDAMNGNGGTHEDKKNPLGLCNEYDDSSRHKLGIAVPHKKVLDALAVSYWY